MNSSDRLKAMYAIWGAFAFAAGFSFAGNQETGTNDLWLAVIFAIVAVVGSVIVMRLNNVEGQESAQAYKPKRNRYNLIDDLDEYELAALRRRRFQLVDRGLVGELAGVQIAHQLLIFGVGEIRLCPLVHAGAERLAPRLGAVLRHAVLRAELVVVVEHVLRYAFGKRRRACEGEA